MGLLSDYLPDFLPADPNQNSAARQGLLQFGAAMLGGRGNFGQVLGGGLAAGAGGYNSALQQLQQKALMDAQTQHIGLENQAAQAAIAKPGQIASILGQGQAPSAQPSAPTSLVTGAPQDLDALSSTPQASQDPSAGRLSSLPQIGATTPSSAPDLSSAPQASAPGQFVTPPIASLPQVGTTSPAAPAQQTTQAQQADLFGKYMGMGDKLAAAGYVADAKPYYDLAQKLRPEVQEVKTALDASGKPVQVITFKDGSQKTSSYGALPENQVVDLGGQQVLIDKNTGKQGSAFAKTVTPGEQLQHTDQVATRAQQDRHWKAEQDAAPEDAPMDPLAVHMVAQQYLAGDAGALTNFGRGKQGAANLNAVRLEVAKQANAAGLNGADIAAKMAEFAGLKAGQRTAGVRSASIEIAANEVAQLAPIALEASSKVPRSGALPFGKAQVMFDSNTNDPAMRQFAMANTALVNAYGQAMARGGAATVSDKDHARELLSTSFDQPSYAAAVAQLQRETRAAQAAPKQVRQDLSDAVSGRPPKLAPVASLPKKQTAGGHPADIDNLLNKYGTH